jgi:hypothetical protein
MATTNYNNSDTFKIYLEAEIRKMKARALEKQRLEEQQLLERATAQEGAHRTHCCVAHGCKYGDRNCPVETGRIQQEYLCEDCHELEGWTSLEQVKNRVQRSMNDEVPLITMENYENLYGKWEVDVSEEVPVTIELLQRIWHTIYDVPETETARLELQAEQDAVMEEIILLLDKHQALPELEEDTTSS